jgi:hypothetical protein
LPVVVAFLHPLTPIIIVIAAQIIASLLAVLRKYRCSFIGFSGKFDVISVYLYM